MKKITKGIFSVLMVFIMLLSYVVPIKNVVAISYGEGENLLKMDINNDLGFTITGVTVNSYNWTDPDDEFYSNNKQFHIVINVSGNETTGDKVPRVQYGSNWNNYIVASTQHNGNNHSFVLDVNDTEGQGFLGLSLEEEEKEQNNNNENNNNNNQNNEEDHGPHFDGKAYLIWSCKDGGVCIHYFDDIPNFDDGASTFYLESDIKDDQTGETFDINAKYKGWSTVDKFDNWVQKYKEFKKIQGEIDWSLVDPKDIVGDPLDMREYEEQAIKAGACTKENTPQDDFESCVDGFVLTKNIWSARAQLQPLPDEPTDNNAYVSYGDRNFKVVIYNNKYKGVSIGDLSELSYYPAYYTNPFIRQDQFDISGTSKDNPTVIDSILLEKTVKIKTLNYNSFDISKIEALDVPSNAVSITKENGEWRLVFSSNFYDNVVFKVTDSKGGTEYFRVNRYTISGYLRFVDNKPTISADFYFDRNKSYTDFNVVAKIIYRDGKTKRVNLSAIDGIDDGLGNITPGYEADEQASQEFANSGKGLKKSTFEYKLNEGEDRTISKVYLNVEYKGSTNNNYAGAFSGSGNGVEINFGEEE